MAMRLVEEHVDLIHVFALLDGVVQHGKDFPGPRADGLNLLLGGLLDFLGAPAHVRGVGVDGGALLGHMFHMILGVGGVCADYGGAAGDFLQSRRKLGGQAVQGLYAVVGILGPAADVAHHAADALGAVLKRVHGALYGRDDGFFHNAKSRRDQKNSAQKSHGADDQS